MLREDPSYFQDVLEARCKMITYLIGEVKRAPLTQLRKEKILDEACRAVIHDPYKNLIIWDISKRTLAMSGSCARPLPEFFVTFPLPRHVLPLKILFKKANADIGIC